jgi:hypothetical protein
MGRIPLFRGDVHTSVTSGDQPAMLAGNCGLGVYTYASAISHRPVRPPRAQLHDVGYGAHLRARSRGKR